MTWIYANSTVLMNLCYSDDCSLWILRIFHLPNKLVLLLYYYLKKWMASSFNLTRCSQSTDNRIVKTDLFSLKLHIISFVVTMVHTQVIYLPLKAQAILGNFSFIVLVFQTVKLFCFCINVTEIFLQNFFFFFLSHIGIWTLHFFY